jgi:deoxyribodipyrimidine photo-lyase
VIVLLTRDLRLHDHPALAEACLTAQTVVPLFVHDTALVGRPGSSSNRVQFLAESLEDLQRSLAERGGRLFVREGDPTEETLKVAAEVDAGAVFISADVSRHARRRQERLAGACQQQRLKLTAFPGVNVVEPGQLVPRGGDHYRVFTPYWNRWRSTTDSLGQIRVPDGLAPGRLQRVARGGHGPSSPNLPAGGEAAARMRAQQWVRRNLSGYEASHDDLAGDTTSRLSPYLHFGCLSPIELAHLAVQNGGGEAFVRQLCWRDFHHQVMAAFPELPRQDYRRSGRRWRHDPAGLEAWRAGLTGIPIVDAGMRQLRSEGWMHNRARLLVASFLTRDLGVHWRPGAEHFMDWLVDGDAANNSGNWQWVAGTGNDTRPNRRFNLIRQGRRFDPQGEYVRRYVTELAAVPGAAVHEPWKLDPYTEGLEKYPAPIVDLSISGN